MAKNYPAVKLLVAALGVLDKDIIEAVGKAVQENITDMEVRVKAAAPKPGDVTPKINGGGKIVDVNISSFTYKTFANSGANAEMGIQNQISDLAAYIEFGTGQDAAGYVPTLEDDFQKQALQFYKNGKGTLAHVPFFLPAWYFTRDKIVKDAQENLNNLQI